jgi:hypothetical protein
MASAKSAEKKPRAYIKRANKPVKTATEKLLEQFKLLNPLAVRTTEYVGGGKSIDFLLPDSSGNPYPVGLEQAVLMNRTAKAAEEIRSLKSRIQKRIPGLEGLQDLSSKDEIMALLSAEQKSILRLSNKEFAERTM